jgi:hypothetical protein
MTAFLSAFLDSHPALRDTVGLLYYLATGRL